MVYPNPYLANAPFGTFGGVQIIDSEIVGDPYEDWSNVRSPSRAARRRKLGHPQRVVTRYKANGQVFQDKARNVIYMHPHDRMRLEQALRERR